MTGVQIVVTCSERKRAKPPRFLGARSLPDVSLDARADEWIGRLESYPCPAMVAASLYAGEHWKAVGDLLRTAESSGFLPRLWIASAGYGLIPGEAAIMPYAATFGRGHADSVTRPGDAVGSAARWWHSLAAWEGPAPGSPRTLAQVAEQARTTPLLVVASPAYLAAMAEDASEAADILGESFFAVSAGARSLTSVDRFLVPATARLQQAVGGSKMSLNVRVAGLMLASAEGDLKRDSVAARLQNAEASLPDPQVYAREKLLDEEVVSWVRESLQEDDSLTASSALRKLRDEGRACEQRRFGRLFHIARGATPGAPPRTAGAGRQEKGE